MTRVLTAVFLMAVVTYLPRVLPLALMRNKIKSRFIRSFLYYVPFAVLGAMTFPSIFFSTGNLISASVGTVVALILAYLEQGLLKVAVAAITAVFVCELLMRL